MADEAQTETVETTPLATDQANDAQKDGDQTQVEAGADDAADEASGDHESDQDGTDLTGDKNGRKRTFQGRIDDLTAKLRQAERERDIYKGAADPTPAQNSPEGAKPSRDDFISDDDYLEALADWKIDDRMAKQAQAREEMTLEVTWEQRQTEAMKAIPDYADVVSKSAVVVLPHIQRAILESPEGPQLAYHLAQNPQVAEALNKSSPIQAVMELAKIGVKLTDSPARSASKAPAPITPVTGQGNNVTDMSKLDMDAYIEARRKQGARF